MGEGRCARGALRGATLVVSIQPTALEDFDHGALLPRLHRSRLGAVHGESLMTAPLMVVGEVGAEQAAQMPTIDHDDV